MRLTSKEMINRWVIIIVIVYIYIYIYYYRNDEVEGDLLLYSVIIIYNARANGRRDVVEGQAGTGSR